MKNMFKITHLLQSMTDFLFNSALLLSPAFGSQNKAIGKLNIHLGFKSKKLSVGVDIFGLNC